MKQTIAEALARKGYDTLTPVQQAVTQDTLEGRDLLVSAQTGSGKTIAFGLAIAPTLLADAEAFGPAEAPLALIIAPTRELALQVKRELGWLYRDAGGYLASCVGGMDMRDERRALARGAHLVVATPGRLRDHIMRGSIDLSQVRAVVLDEADEMLDLGFREDLEFILDQIPTERQTLLFSATVPPAIAKLAQRFQKDAERISTVSPATQHADIEYRAALVAPGDGENAVINLLRYYEAPNAIVFCNTRAMVARLTTRLSNRGFSVVALSGELTQSERSNALQAMRDGRARVCVATDVAARGIDLPRLDLVVHAELPSSHETLLHRSGRTGRAGRKGVSALVVVPASRKKAERVLKFAKVTADWGTAPSAAEIDARDDARMMASEDWADAVTEKERGAVDTLVGAFSPEQLAAAYLRQYKQRHSAPEDLVPVSADAPKKRGPFGPSVWFSLSEGRADAASPRHVLPMICKAGGITKDDIGAIRIAETETYVELRERAVAGFLETLGPSMTIEGDKSVTQLERAPDLPQFTPAPRKQGGKPKHMARGKGEPRDHGRGKPRPAEGSKPVRKVAPKPERAPRPDRALSEDAPVQPGKPHRAKETSTAQQPARKAKLSAGKPRARAEDRPKSEAPPRRKPGKDAPARKRATGPKGPPPPKGKPNSKKNRARAAAKLAQAGGDTMPKRR